MLRLRVITGDWEGLGFSRTAVHPDSKHEDVGHRSGLGSQRPGAPRFPHLAHVHTALLDPMCRPWCTFLTGGEDAAAWCDLNVLSTEPRGRWG